jgi:hypothetical protein
MHDYRGTVEHILHINTKAFSRVRRNKTVDSEGDIQHCAACLILLKTSEANVILWFDLQATVEMCAHVSGKQEA